jgi:quercetin dioxygenase-like cupin family protein
MGTAEIAPGAAAGRHIHHGEEFGYVLDGSATLEVEGKAPQELKAGMAYHIDREKAHDAQVAASGGPAKVLAVYIVDKGKPLAEPAK